ncbi:MAG: glycosyltransferase family 39 protein [Candidatus Nanohaloarchaeota archaeon QJJ-7]|nr:glycosyltransferase family 39 protein [Candidatus Nanohaloarchaeota archaeon QJJ-7]
MDIDSRELKIFFTFLFIFTLFIHWGGVNSYSRYDLTKSIVQKGETDISSYSSNTIDKIALGSVNVSDYLNGSQKEIWENFTWGGSKIEPDASRSFLLNLTGGGKVVPVDRRSELQDLRSEVREAAYKERQTNIYSDKAPLASLIAVPAYAFVDSLGLQDDTVWVEKKKVEIPARTSLKLGLSQFLITLMVPVFFGTLLMVLIYRDTRHEIDTERPALIAVLALGLATPMFFYSTTFFGVITASAFTYLSFYLVKGYLRYEDVRYLLVAGVSGGLAITAEYYTGIVPFVLLIYIWSRKRELIPSAYYAAAVVIGLVPLLIYNYVSTGNPFFPVFFQGFTEIICSAYTSCFVRGSSFIVLDPARIVNIGIRLLLFPTRGVFFYSPILLAALPGFVYLYREDRSNLVYLAVFILFLLFNASWKLWMAGLSFGPRYLLPALPFFGIPLAYGVREMLDRGVHWQGLVAGLLVLSFAITLTGFTSGGEKEVSPVEYEERFNSFQPIKPDLWSERIQGVMETGPRSPFLEILLGQRKDYSFSYSAPQVQLLEISRLPESFLLLNTAFLPIALLLLALMLVFCRFRMRGFLAVAVVITLLLSLQISEMYYGEGFYSNNIEEDNRWMSESGKINFYSAGNESIYFKAGISESLGNSSLELYLNDERLDGFNLKTSGGINRLELRSSKGCTTSIPGDSRCRSFLIKNFSLIPSDETPEAIFYKGWHPLGVNEQNRWMRDRAEFVFNPAPEEELLFLTLGPHHSFAERVVELQVNNRTKNKYWIRGRETIVLYNNSFEGGDKLKLAVPEGCVETEAGCYSFLLTDFELQSWHEAAKNIDSTVFYQNWYRQENINGDRLRWMSNEAVLIINSPEKKNISFSGDIWAFNATGRNLDIKQITARDIERHHISILEYPWRVSTDLNITLDPGVNIFQFESDPGCGESGYGRCISLAFENFNFTDEP